MQTENFIYGYSLTHQSSTDGIFAVAESTSSGYRLHYVHTDNLGNAEVRHTDGYPGWTPNPDSEICAIAEKAYKKRFGKDPKVKAIHAGLECGLIGDKIAGMDMISFGPTLRGVHSPDERIEIATVQKFWDLLCDILLEIPKK